MQHYHTKPKPGGNVFNRVPFLVLREGNIARVRELPTQNKVGGERLDPR